MKLFCAVLVTLAAVCRAEPPVNRYLPSKPNSQYGAPSAGGFSAPSAPSQQYGAPSQQYGAPSQQYGAPNGGNNGQTHAVFGSSRPSSNYGAPKPSQNYGAPSSQYLPSNQGYSGGHGNGHGDEEYNEPANYQFEYMVKDDHYGTDFGHKEARQGDRAEGEYYVLLPDGRKQIVRYEADENGYRPKISYEDTGAGYGRGPANGGYSGGNGNGGHQNGGQGGYQNGGQGGYQNGGYQNGGHGGY